MSSQSEEVVVVTDVVLTKHRLKDLRQSDFRRTGRCFEVDSQNVGEAFFEQCSIDFATGFNGKFIDRDNASGNCEASSSYSLSGTDD